MGLVNLKDLIEAASHKWYKDNEKDSTKAKWGKTYNWKELVKEIDWRSLKFVIQFVYLINFYFFNLEYVMIK
jgi:hypothetical protein